MTPSPGLGGLSFTHGLDQSRFPGRLSAVSQGLEFRQNFWKARRSPPPVTWERSLPSYGPALLPGVAPTLDPGPQASSPIVQGLASRVTALSQNWGLPPCQPRAAPGSLRTSSTQRWRGGWTEEGEENGAPPPPCPRKGTHAHHRHGHHQSEHPWEQPPVTMEGAGHQAARLQAGQGCPEGPRDTLSPVPQPLLLTGLSPGQARPPSGCSPRRCVFLEPTPPVNPAGLGGSLPPTPQVPSSGPRGGLPPSCPRSCRSQPSRGPARRQRVSPAWSPHPPASPGGRRREGAGPPLRGGAALT